jgi:hypothetical protein
MASKTHKGINTTAVDKAFESLGIYCASNISMVINIREHLCIYQYDNYLGAYNRFAPRANIPVPLTK